MDNLASLSHTADDLKNQFSEGKLDPELAELYLEQLGEDPQQATSDLKAWDLDRAVDDESSLDPNTIPNLDSTTLSDSVNSSDPNTTQPASLANFSAEFSSSLPDSSDPSDPSDTTSASSSLSDLIADNNTEHLSPLGSSLMTSLFSAKEPYTSTRSLGSTPASVSDTSDFVWKDIIPDLNGTEYPPDGYQYDTQVRPYLASILDKLNSELVDLTHPHHPDLTKKESRRLEFLERQLDFLEAKHTNSEWLAFKESDLQRPQSLSPSRKPSLTTPNGASFWFKDFRKELRDSLFIKSPKGHFDLNPKFFDIDAASKDPFYAPKRARQLYDELYAKYADHYGDYSTPEWKADYAQFLEDNPIGLSLSQDQADAYYKNLDKGAALPADSFDGSSNSEPESEPDYLGTYLRDPKRAYSPNWLSPDESISWSEAKRRKAKTWVPQTSFDPEKDPKMRSLLKKGFMQFPEAQFRKWVFDSYEGLDPADKPSAALVKARAAYASAFNEAWERAEAQFRKWVFDSYEGLDPADKSREVLVKARAAYAAKVGDDPKVKEALAVLRKVAHEEPDAGTDSSIKAAIKAALMGDVAEAVRLHPPKPGSMLAYLAKELGSGFIQGIHPPQHAFEDDAYSPNRGYYSIKVQHAHDPNSNFVPNADRPSKSKSNAPVSSSPDPLEEGSDSSDFSDVALTLSSVLNLGSPIFSEAGKLVVTDPITGEERESAGTYRSELRRFDPTGYDKVLAFYAKVTGLSEADPRLVKIADAYFKHAYTDNSRPHADGTEADFDPEDALRFYERVQHDLYDPTDLMPQEEYNQDFADTATYGLKGSPGKWGNEIKRLVGKLTADLAAKYGVVAKPKLDSGSGAYLPENLSSDSWTPQGNNPKWSTPDTFVYTYRLNGSDLAVLGPPGTGKDKSPNSPILEITFSVSDSTGFSDESDESDGSSESTSTNVSADAESPVKAKPSRKAAVDLDLSLSYKPYISQFADFLMSSKDPSDLDSLYYQLSALTAEDLDLLLSGMDYESDVSTQGDWESSGGADLADALGDESYNYDPNESFDWSSESSSNDSAIAGVAGRKLSKDRPEDFLIGLAWTERQIALLTKELDSLPSESDLSDSIAGIEDAFKRGALSEEEYSDEIKSLQKDQSRVKQIAEYLPKHSANLSKFWDLYAASRSAQSNASKAPGFADNLDAISETIDSITKQSSLLTKRLKDPKFLAKANAPLSEDWKFFSEERDRLEALIQTLESELPALRILYGKLDAPSRVDRAQAYGRTVDTMPDYVPGRNAAYDSPRRFASIEDRQQYIEDLKTGKIPGGDEELEYAQGIGVGPHVDFEVIDTPESGDPTESKDVRRLMLKQIKSYEPLLRLLMAPDLPPADLLRFKKKFADLQRSDPLQRYGYGFSFSTYKATQDDLDEAKKALDSFIREYRATPEEYLDIPSLRSRYNELYQNYIDLATAPYKESISRRSLARDPDRAGVDTWGRAEDPYDLFTGDPVEDDGLVMARARISDIRYESPVIDYEDEEDLKKKLKSDRFLGERGYFYKESPSIPLDISVRDGAEQAYPEFATPFFNWLDRELAAAQPKPKPERKASGPKTPSLNYITYSSDAPPEAKEAYLAEYGKSLTGKDRASVIARNREAIKKEIAKRQAKNPEASVEDLETKLAWWDDLTAKSPDPETIKRKQLKAHDLEVARRDRFREGAKLHLPKNLEAFRESYSDDVFESLQNFATHNFKAAAFESWLKDQAKSGKYSKADIQAKKREFNSSITDEERAYKTLDPIAALVVKVAKLDDLPYEVKQTVGPDGEKKQDIKWKWPVIESKEGATIDIDKIFDLFMKNAPDFAFEAKESKKSSGTKSNKSTAGTDVDFTL